MVTDCWIWTGATNKGGYGVVRHGGRVGSVHRLVMDAPPGQTVRHTCDNPPCYNPHHLISGTQAENMLDMKSKGRASRSFKSRSNATVTWDDVRSIREMHERGCTPAEIGVRYPQIGRGAIYRITRNQTWKEDT